MQYHYNLYTLTRSSEFQTGTRSREVWKQGSEEKISSTQAQHASTMKKIVFK